MACDMQIIDKITKVEKVKRNKKLIELLTNTINSRIGSMEHLSVL